MVTTLDQVNDRINAIIDGMEADGFSIEDQLIVLQAAYAFVLADHVDSRDDLETVLADGLSLTSDWARMRFVEIGADAPTAGQDV